jgi:hypothetical protein
MEPEGSLPCSKKPSTGPYPEPNQSSPHHPILRSILILSTHLRVGLPSGLFPSGFSTNIYWHDRVINNENASHRREELRTDWHMSLLLAVAQQNRMQRKNWSQVLKGSKTLNWFMICSQFTHSDPDSSSEVMPKECTKHARRAGPCSWVPSLYFLWQRCKERGTTCGNYSTRRKKYL